jgi:glyoxylase-like metal-dependent hydrolase (beta-lactamase superfamily II)
MATAPRADAADTLRLKRGSTIDRSANTGTGSRVTMPDMSTDQNQRLSFRQLLAGRDFATDSMVAAQMVNFVYLIGDRQHGDCLLVDPAWDVDGLLQLIEADGLRPAGALCTHYHPDHVGGDLFGQQIQGVAELLELRGVKVHAHRHDADGIRTVTGIGESDLVRHDGGDRVSVGDIEIEIVHTPGHTPGSQCFLVDDRLVAGDTLFVQGCGRVDLPGGDPDEMYRTLTQRLAKFGDGTVLYPGHHYGDRPTSTLGDERRHNTYLRVNSLEDWRRMMGIPWSD